MTGIERGKDCLDSEMSTEVLSREQVYEGLRSCVWRLQKNDWSQRSWNNTGANRLLDRLIEIQHAEAIEMLEDEQEVGFGL